MEFVVESGGVFELQFVERGETVGVLGEEVLF